MGPGQAVRVPVPSEPASGAPAAPPGGGREGLRRDNGAHRVQGEGVREDRGRCHQAQGPVTQSIFA